MVGRVRNPQASSSCPAGHFFGACGAFNKMLKKRGKEEKREKGKGGEKERRREKSRFPGAAAERN